MINLTIEKTRPREVFAHRGRAQTFEPALNSEYPRGTGKVVLHRVREHYGQPEKTGDGREPDKFRAPIHVHEEQHYARHLGKCDQKGDQRVGTWKYPVHVDGGGIIRKYSSDYEHRKYPEILRDRHVVVLHVFVFRVSISHISSA